MRCGGEKANNDEEKDKTGRYVVERKPREDKVGEGGVRDPPRDASGPQPIAASDQSPDRYHFPIKKGGTKCSEN
jgi:hypothetical protein